MAMEQQVAGLDIGSSERQGRICSNTESGGVDYTRLYSGL